jgi:hypothetical protein
MKLSSMELGGVALLIVYVAFFTHPPPSVVSSLLSSPIGHGLVLLAVLYVGMNYSMILGLFLGIAYVMSASSTLEYLDPKEQKPKDAAQPKANGIPPAAISGMLAAMTDKKKGDVRLPQSHGKAEHTKPDAPAQPKPTPPAKIENFSSF